MLFSFTSLCAASAALEKPMWSPTLAAKSVHSAHSNHPPRYAFFPRPRHAGWKVFEQALHLMQLPFCLRVVEHIKHKPAYFRRISVHSGQDQLYFSINIFMACWLWWVRPTSSFLALKWGSGLWFPNPNDQRFKVVGACDGACFGIIALPPLGTCAGF
jgi:hypothetical protein